MPWANKKRNNFGSRCGLASKWWIVCSTASAGASFLDFYHGDTEARRKTISLCLGKHGRLTLVIPALSEVDGGGIWVVACNTSVSPCLRGGVPFFDRYHGDTRGTKKT